MTGISTDEIAHDIANEQALGRAHERWLTPPAELPECSVCKGWGVILGTDTEDSYGDACGCGRAMQRPRNHDEAEELAVAHQEARRRPAKSAR